MHTEVPIGKPSKHVNATANETTWHPNVYWMFLFRFISGISYATRSASIFDNYIRMQFGDNTTVGLMSTSQLMAVLVLSPFTAHICDRYHNRRRLLLQLLSLFGLFCMVVNYLGLINDSLRILLFSSFCWSVWYETVYIISESLLTDSVLPNQRSQVYVYRRIIATLSRGIGPLFSLSLFHFSKDTWDLHIVRRVLQYGLLFSVLQVITLWNWKDVDRSKVKQIENKKTTIDISNKILGLKRKNVPWLIWLSHNINFLGAGMTVKYFPLFFIQQFGFQPIHTCLLSTTYTLSIALSTLALYHISKRYGRARSAIISIFLGSICLYIFRRATNLPIVIAFYLLRGGLQNAPAPLNRSLIQEIVPVESRSKWIAMESLSAVSWSISAIIGGIISDAKDYRYNFMITGILYIFGIIIYSPCAIIMRERMDKKETQKNDNNDDDTIILETEETALQRADPNAIETKETALRKQLEK